MGSGRIRLYIIILRYLVILSSAYLRFLLIILRLAPYIRITRLSSEVKACACNIEFCSIPRLWCRHREFRRCWYYTRIEIASKTIIRHVVNLSEMLRRHIKLSLVWEARIVILLYLVVILQVPLQLPFDMLIYKGQECLFIETIVEIIGNVDAWL